MARIPRTNLGRTGLSASRIAFGTSALGGVFGAVDSLEAERTVMRAFEAGINLFDSAPAYGNTASEQVLGRALSNLPRNEVLICTKAGKQTDDSGRDSFDYSEEAIRRSVAESCQRLGTDYLDILLLHDFDAESADTEQALTEGFDTLRALKAEGRVRVIGAGIYDMALWKRVLSEQEIDVALVHNHHTLVDIRIFELLPLLEAQGVGLISAAPFGSGLLTGQPLPDWHPAPQQVRAAVRRAAALAEEYGSSLPALALQFATSEPRVPATLFSCSNPGELDRSLGWYAAEIDRILVARVQQILEPVMNRSWPFGEEASAESTAEYHD